MEMTAKKDYKIVSPNHFESLSSSNNDKDNFLSDQNTFAKIYAFVPKNIIERSVRLGNSYTRTNTHQIPLKNPDLN